jgi:predicted membrane-bound spermidine synthase
VILFRLATPKPQTTSSARLYALWLYYRLRRNQARTGWTVEEGRN